MATTINSNTTDGIVITPDTSGEIELQANGVTKAKVTANGLQDANGNSLRGGSFRNLIINGDMRIDQRNAGASVVNVSGKQFTLDRFYNATTQSSKFSVQQNAGSVTPPDGFTSYLGVTSSSAYSVLSNDYFLIRHRVEGLNVSHINWGTTNAKTVTLSFWVRSSLTGTFSGGITNSGQTRTYVFSYTIDSANTWERKTITIEGDTTGTWLTTNGIGIQLDINLGSGSTYTTTSGSWQSGAYVNVSGATSVVGTSGATFYITGVQLEVGDTATPFEHRPYDMELARCQRYLPALNGRYWTATGYNIINNIGVGFIKFPVTARVPATGISFSSLSHFTVANNTNTSYIPIGISFDVFPPHC